MACSRPLSPCSHMVPMLRTRNIMRKWILLIALFLTPIGVKAKGLESEVEAFRLKNGMRWLVVHRPQVPVFSGMIMVRAGGMDETPGLSGLAHMFEHIAFKGSPRIGTRNYAREKPILKKIGELGEQLVAEEKKEPANPEKIEALRKEIWSLTEEQSEYFIRNDVWTKLTLAGAVGLNAFTSKDATGYHLSLPAEAFPKWALIASEMVFQPVMREFYQERDVVLEERKTRYENSAGGFLIDALIRTAFPEGPYHTMTIGHEKDIRNLTMQAAADFHEKNYVPGNAVGVLVGAISKKGALPILEKTFGKKPSGPIPLDVPKQSFAFQGDRRATVAYPASPMIVVGFYKPTLPDPVDYVFDVLNSVLCDGRTAILYKELVEKRKWVSSVDCGNGYPGSRHDNLFLVFLEPHRGKSLEKIEKGLFSILTSLREKITDEDIQKVREGALYSHYWEMEDNMSLAQSLADAETILGDWRHVARFTERIQAVTREEVVSAAEKYMVKNNSVTVYRLQK